MKGQNNLLLRRGQEMAERLILSSTRPIDCPVRVSAILEGDFGEGLGRFLYPVANGYWTVGRVRG